MRRERTHSAVALALLSAALAVRGVFAEGPGTGGRAIRLDAEPAGPYLLRVVTSPTPPRVGSLFLEIRVTGAGSGQVLTDVQVLTFATPLEQEGPGLQAAATHAFAPNPIEYAAHLPVGSAGVWEVGVRVEGELGQGEARFLQRVSGSAALGVGLSLALPVAGVAALLLAFALLQRRGRSELNEPA